MVKKTLGKSESNSLRMSMHQYELTGRAAPTEKIPYPKIYKMKLFAKNAVLARSKFWYFMKRINCAKRSGGQILRQIELFDKSPTKVSNYGIWLRYESRTDTHNMYKEYRDTTITGAVSQMVQEMAGRHRAQQSAIQILRTAEIEKSKIRRSNTLQFQSKKVKFPMVRRTPMDSRQSRNKSLLKGKRWGTFAQ